MLKVLRNHCTNGSTREPVPRMSRAEDMHQSAGQDGRRELLGGLANDWYLGHLDRVQRLPHGLKILSHRVGWPGLAGRFERLGAKGRIGHVESVLEEWKEETSAGSWPS